MSDLPSEDALTLDRTVVQGGYCIGCGVCASVPDSPFTIGDDGKGQYVAQLSKPGGADGLQAVCPFSQKAASEDELGRALFPTGTADPHLGFHQAAYTGYVAEGTFRERGSSGGVGKWALAEMLRTGLVDRVIQVAATAGPGRDEVLDSPTGDELYRFELFDDADAVLEQGSRSVYYPVELSGALAYVREHPGRYAVTAVPCFAKALRLLIRQDAVLRERVRFVVGLVCGHLKSDRYAELIGWQLGVPPGELGALDFRRKLPGAHANHKGVAASYRDASKPDPEPDIVQNLYGTNYNHGFFQYAACDFCDDVLAETADLSVGDAWLPEFLKDGRGTCIVVVRNPVLHDMVEAARREGRLALDVAAPDRIAASQVGGFRQRREGLSYRLHLTDRAGQWRPPKRVAPSRLPLKPKRRAIYELRIELTKRSHAAYARARALADLDVMKREMAPLLDAYAALYKPTFFHRVRRGLERRGERMGRRAVAAFRTVFPSTPR